MGMSKRFTNYMGDVKRQSTDEGPVEAQLLTVTEETNVVWREGHILMIDTKTTPDAQKDFESEDYFNTRSTDATPTIPCAYALPLEALNAKLARTPCASYQDYSDTAARWRVGGIVRAPMPPRDNVPNERLIVYTHLGMLKTMKKVVILQPGQQLVLMVKIVPQMENGVVVPVVRFIPMGIDVYQPPRKDLLKLNVDEYEENKTRPPIHQTWGVADWVPCFHHQVCMANADPQVKRDMITIQTAKNNDTGYLGYNHRMICSSGNHAEEADYDAEVLNQVHIMMPAFKE